MTVGQLLSSMSAYELNEWRRFFTWRDSEMRSRAEFEAKAAEADRWVKGG